jgi:hypothetical protein
MHGPSCIVWANLTPFSLEITFTSLDVEADYDFVHVYDGVGSSTPAVRP